MTLPDFYLDPHRVIGAAARARDHSGTVTNYLNAIDRDVQDLLAIWRGDAAKAYSESWDELLELLRKMATELDGIGADTADSAQTFVNVDRG